MSIKMLLGRVYVLVLSGLILFYGKVAAAPFALKGNVMGLSRGWIYLNYLPGNGKRGVIDSCSISNGNFHFSGEIEEPCLATLSTFNLFNSNYTNDDSNIVGFYLDKGRLAVSLIYSHFSQIVVEGSSTERDRIELQALTRDVHRQLLAVSEMLTANYRAWRKRQDSSGTKLPWTAPDSLSALEGKLQKKEWQLDSLFIFQHPHSFLTADMLANGTPECVPFAYLPQFYRNFPKRIRESRPGRQIQEELEKEKAVHPGSTAFPFTAITSAGDTFYLRSQRDKKYILLDFWASWCAPCRAIGPELQRIHQKFGEKVKIISIAFNDKDEKWRKAIQEDKFGWTQINDSNAYVIVPANRSISKPYRINLIPALILLDKDLKVVAKYGGWYDGRSVNDIEKNLEVLFTH